jgi:hypothetical protein
LGHAPFVLQAYLVFVLVYATLSMAASLVRPLGEVLIPYTGWRGGIDYLFTLYFAGATAATAQRKLIYIVILLLGFFALGGVLEFNGHVVSPDPARMKPGNPALFFHELRPAVTIVLPLAWLCLLLSPSMRKWVKAAPGEDDRQGRQFSVADLLYLMLVVCVALAAGLALAGQMRKARESVTSVPADSSLPTSAPVESRTGNP